MKITKDLLKQLIKEEIAALNEEESEESAIKDAKEFVARLVKHGQSKGGFRNDKIRKKFIELAIEAAKEHSKSSGGVFPMYPRLFNDIVSTIEKGNESKIYKQSTVPASKTKTSVIDCRISGLRRVKTEKKNNILTVTVEKDGKQAIGSQRVRGGLRDLAMRAAEDKARAAWIEKHGCPE